MLRVGNATIIPIADESLGVRSMSLYLETPDVKVLFDAGASLGPLRYGLPPHPEEFRALKKLREKILYYADRADIITVSHYHRDHYTPPHASLYECTEEKTFLDIYSDKTILAKSPTSNINFNQKRRAYAFFKALEESKSNAKVNFLDSGRVDLGETSIEGFLAVHGDEKLGWVLCFKVYLEGEGVLVFMPDVQGPVSDEALSVLLNEGFKVAVIGGPPTYLEKRSGKKLEKGLKNFARALKVERFNIISHHILRDLGWREVVDALAPGSNFHLYSEVAGLEFTPLEAYRKLLYETDPPPKSYLESLRSGRLGCYDF